MSTSLSDTAQPIEFDPFSVNAHDDPYPMYRQLRDHAPVYYSELRDVWMLSRFEDVQSASRDWQTFSSAEGVDPDGAGQELHLNSFLDLDPVRHDELRRIVRDRFTPTAVNAATGEVADRTGRLISAFIERGEADLASELAWPLPIGIISAFIGVPLEDQPEVEVRFRALLDRDMSADPTELPRGAREATDGLRGYFEHALEGRMRAPADDLLTTISEALRAGELDRSEAVEMCFILFIAGFETTASLISTSLVLLGEDRAQRAWLASDRGRIPQAIEELLRFESPIQFLARTTTREVEMHGTTIPQGARVFFLYGSANRDERKFEDPDRLDLSREIGRHLAFGDGIHHCLGSLLARLEGRIALEAILDRLPDYELTGPVRRTSFLVTRGYASIPVMFTSGAP